MVECLAPDDGRHRRPDIRLHDAAPNILIEFKLPDEKDQKTATACLVDRSESVRTGRQPIANRPNLHLDDGVRRWILTERPGIGCSEVQSIERIALEVAVGLPIQMGIESELGRSVQFNANPLAIGHLPKQVDPPRPDGDLTIGREALRRLEPVPESLLLPVLRGTTLY